MIENEQVSKRPKSLEEGIDELIEIINASRNEAPKKGVKDLRILLQEMRDEIHMINKKDLQDKLEYVFSKLGGINSKSENLVKAQNHAFELWKNFPHYQNNLKTGAPIRK